MTNNESKEGGKTSSLHPLFIGNSILIHKKTAAK
jgi:hypothetical protein